LTIIKKAILYCFYYSFFAEEVKMLKRRLALFGVLLAAIALLLVPMGNAQDDGELTCNTRGIELEGDMGDVLSVSCPADCTQGIIWGTGVYTDDSYVCTAAIHAGALDENGGDVEVSILEGQEEYLASEENGILSSSWGQWDRSFGFGETPREEVIQFSCFDTSVEGAEIGDAYQGVCPSGCEAGSIWGTGIYTEDSTICTAAAHAGVTTLEEGGEFTIAFLDGQASYSASEQNDISSSEWGSWDISFGFTDVIGCRTAANEFEGETGASGLITCQAGCGAETVWGSDIYTDDSSICTAAAHAGVISLDDGGTFMLTIEEGQESYEGSEENDIESFEYGEWPRSFSVSPVDDQIVSCEATSYDLTGEVGTEYTITCPSDCEAGTIWGTDIYSDGSNLCTAAAHAGIIDLEDGGSFVVTIEEGEEEYEGSEQNDIESLEYGEWDRSFSVDEE
jgi:hypothetical protein